MVSLFLSQGFTARRSLRERLFGSWGRICSLPKTICQPVVNGRGAWFFIVKWLECIDCTIYHFSTLEEGEGKTVTGARSLKHVFCSRQMNLMIPPESLGTNSQVSPTAQTPRTKLACPT